MIEHAQHSALLPTPHGFFDRRSGEEILPTLKASRLFLPHQYHSAVALYIDGNTPAGARADAVISDQAGIALGVRTADCVPVLFYAPGWVGAAHAGWRGSLSGILEATIALFDAHGVNAQDLSCAIGPSLRSPLFEVRDDLRSAVLGRYAESERFFSHHEGEQWDYDHIAFVKWRLCEAGMGLNRIDDVGGNTLAHPERWYSHRAGLRQGKSEKGRNISAINLMNA